MLDVLHLLIPSAYADAMATPPPPQGGGVSFVFMLTMIFVFAYLLIWRPQSKRARAQQNLLASLAKGDEVVTIGGLLGCIALLTDQYIVISVADTVEVIIQKSSVANVLPKGTLKSLHR
jgi:preprotein translocase subunit YajC